MSFFAPNSGLSIALQAPPPAPAGFSATWRGYRELEGAGPYTFVDVDVGPATAERIVAVGFLVNTTSGLIDSVTIGGVAASRVVSNVSPTTRLLEIWEAVVSVGEAADIVVVPTAAASRIGIAWYSILGSGQGFVARSGTAPTVLTSNTVTATLSSDAPEGGVTIAFASHTGGSGDGRTTWTQSAGVGGQLHDQQIAGGHWFSLYETDQPGPLAITATHTLAANAFRIAAAAWGP